MLFTQRINLEWKILVNYMAYTRIFKAVTMVFRKLIKHCEDMIKIVTENNYNIHRRNKVFQYLCFSACYAFWNDSVFRPWIERSRLCLVKFVLIKKVYWPILLKLFILCIYTRQLPIYFHFLYCGWFCKYNLANLSLSIILSIQFYFKKNVYAKSFR